MSERRHPTRAARPRPAAGGRTETRDGAAETPELRGLRRRIDAVDRRIVALLNERARLAIAVGRAKRGAGWRAIRDAERERDVLERVVAANGGPLGDEALRAVYRRIIAATRTLEADRNGLDEGWTEEA